MNEDLPEGWASVALADAVEPGALIQYGILQPGPDIPSGVPYVRPTEIRDFQVDVQSLRRTTADIANNYRRSSLKPGDVILSIVGSIGKVAIVPPSLDGANITQSSARLRPHKALVSSELLALFLRSPTATMQFDNATLGTGVPRLNIGDIRAFTMPLPPFAEQRRIVAKVEELLVQVNTAKGRLAKVPAILKRFRQSVLAAACSGKLTEDWRAAQTNASSADDFLAGAKAALAKSQPRQLDEYQSDAEPLESPTGWVRVPLGCVAESLDRLRRPINRDERAGRSGDIPYYGANGQVGWIDQHIFDEDIVLVVEDETFIGREKPFSYVVRGKSWVNNHAHVLRPLAGMSADYLNTVLAFYDFIPLTSGTTGRRKLTKAGLLSAPVVVAPLDEQQEIARRVHVAFAALDAIESNVNRAIEVAARVTSAVLAKAFRGELVPSEAELALAEGRDYETAEQLIARVRAGSEATPRVGPGAKTKRKRRANAESAEAG